MAKNEQLDLARWVTEATVKAGAEQARASVDRTRYVNLEYRERRVETLEESSTNGLSLDIYAGGKYSSHRTSDLRRDALKKFIAESVALTRYLTEDPFRTLPDPKFYGGRKDVDLELHDDAYAKVSADKRHQVVQAVEAAGLDRGGDDIIAVEAGYYDSITRSAMVSSNGFEGTTETTSFWAGASVTARDEGDKRPSDWWWQGGVNRGFVSDPEAIGRRAAERALGRVGADKIETEVLPIIIENRANGRLLGYLARALSGRSLQQKNSFLEGKLGEEVFSPLLTVTDDPLVKQGAGSRLFDGEGLTARRMPVIEKGVLRNYFIDTYYAKKLGVDPTTGSPSNSLFALGDKDQAGWMRELGRGILVTGFIGGNSNNSTGDFSAGIQGYYFEDGGIVKPVAELNVADNHLTFWKKLVGVGNDPYPYSTLRSPCLVFENVTVAGA